MNPCKSVVDLFRVENYFNYFTEIEEHFQRRRGTVLLLSGIKMPAAIGGTAASTSGEPSPGLWQLVQFDRRRPRSLDPGDCELLEQFHRLLELGLAFRG